MTFGLTPQGLMIKKLQDILDEITVNLRTTFGNGLNLLPSSVMGQIQGIFAERLSLIEEDLLGVYNSFFPDLATGVNLDNVVSITGIKRLKAVKATGSGIAYGTLGTVLPAGLVFSVNGNPNAKFVTTSQNIIAAGTNEVQKIQFSAVPDAGNWTLIYNGIETGNLAFNDNAAAVQNALNAIGGLTGVSVAGNYGAGFTVTFTNADGSKPQPLLKAGTNTLTNTGIQINLNFTELTPGVLPNVACAITAQTVGNIPAYANTLTIIETPFAGLSAFNNPLDILNGKDIESDAALRLRRKKTLATAGAGTVDSIRSRLLDIDAVTDARVFENDLDVNDGAGRPPHSFEAVVENGANQAIGDAIWEVKAAGIQTYGGVSVTVVDSMGFNHTVKFSRPAEVDIYMIVTVTVDHSIFPVDGDTAIKDNIVQFAKDNFGIGDDVITVDFFCPITDVLGILNASILIGKINPPVSSNNVAIADDEKSSFDTTRISVVVV